MLHLLTVLSNLTWQNCSAGFDWCFHALADTFLTNIPKYFKEIYFEQQVFCGIAPSYRSTCQLSTALPDIVFIFSALRSILTRRLACCARNIWLSKSLWQCCVRTTPIRTHGAQSVFRSDSLSRGWHCCIPHSSNSYNELPIVPLQAVESLLLSVLSATMEFDTVFDTTAACIQFGFLTIWMPFPQFVGGNCPYGFRKRQEWCLSRC